MIIALLRFMCLLNKRKGVIKLSLNRNVIDKRIRSLKMPCVVGLGCVRPMLNRNCLLSGGNSNDAGS